MECPKCQHENKDGRRFCSRCAAPLPAACPACGFFNDPDDTYCGGCARDLSQALTPTEAPTSTQPPPSTAPTGERRQATVVFSDLSGYTAMNEKLDPEEVEGIMSRIKAEAVKIVEKHGGIVNQFVGDEVLALFGIPTAHEDDPRRAVRAALDLHELARTISPEVGEKLGRSLRMHSSINSGLVVTSSRDVRDGTVGVTGDTVNIAARLVNQAGEDEIVVSPETQRLIKNFFTTEALEPVAMKGKAQPMTPFRVVGESGAKTRFEAAEQRGFTPYTGRERELETLHACLEKAVVGEGQFVTVSGEAGVGKSRLLYEFRQGLNRDRVTVLQGRCQSYGSNTPYLPFIDSLRRGLRLRDDDSHAMLLEKAVANVRAIDPALEQYIPVYLHLLSFSAPEFPLPESMRGEALRQASWEALAAINIQNTRQKPMVLMLEDWHWADEASNAALRYLLGLIAAHQLMVVVIYRLEYAEAWGGLGHHTQMALAPLDASRSEQIIRSVLQAQRLPEGLGERIHERTGGNPFFIEEICSDLLEEETVQVKDGQATLNSSLDRIELPNTVQAVIRSRLDRLDDDQREVMRLASVIGREFGQRILERARQTHKPITQLLEALKSQDLIQQMRVLPEVEYMFKHVLTQVVVYETLLLVRRKALHSLVGHAMEELYADRLEEHVEVLAHHFGNSGETEKTLHYLELAGEKAGNFFSLEQARRYFRDAIDLLERQEEKAEWKQKRIDLTLKWAAVSFYAPTWEHIEILDTSQQYARELEDDARLAQVTYSLGHLYYKLGRMGTEALVEFEQCQEIAERLNDEELLARTVSFIGRIGSHTAHYAKGIEFLEKGIYMLERLGDKAKADLANAQLVLARIYGLTGDFSRSFSLFETALELARAISNPNKEADALIFLGMIKALHGDWKEAGHFSKQGTELASKHGNRELEHFGLMGIGYATFMLGNKEAGITQMQERMKWEESIGNAGMLIFRAWLAELLALENDTKGAAELCQRMVRLKEETGQGTGDVNMQRVLAMVAAQETPPDWHKVDEHMTESIRLAEERGARPELAVTHFRYAELLQKKGGMPQTLDHLDQATALFREREMTWWLEQAVALRKGLGAD